MPVTVIELDTPYQILKIKGNDETKHHLERLGLIEGETITVISKIKGNVIIAVKGARLALDQKLAGHILV